LFIFPKPNQEGDFKLSKLDLFAKIDSSTKYISSSSEMIRNNFNPIIKSLSEPLWRLATMTFSELFEPIVKGIADATGCLTAHPENNLLLANLCFMQNVSCAQSTNLVRFIGKYPDSPYFNKLSFLSELRGILDLNKVQSIQDAIDMLARAMSVFAKYAEHSTGLDLTLKDVMQQYGYTILQEYELVKFFNDIHGSLLPDLQKFVETITLCRDKVIENLRHKTHNIDLEENMTDVSYYITAVGYLNNYNSFICNNIKAKAYLQLAYISEEVMRDDCKARDLYIDAVASNPKLAAVYEKLGNLFFKYDKYENAINCYKVINKEDSIKLCFKKWLKQPSIEKSNIRLKQAKCFEYNRIYDRASKYYRLASSNSSDVEFKSNTMKKSAELWGMAITQQRETTIIKAETGDIPHYDLVTKDFIKDLHEAEMATSELKQLNRTKCKY
jgi:tetratricopeptide (TPR) repeat protein